MANVWTLVGLAVAVAILLFVVFVIESEVHAKIEELKDRRRLKKLEKELDKCIGNLTITNEDIIKALSETEDEEE